MSSLEAKKITPTTGTTVTLGAAGDTVDVSATALKTNTIKDAGGNTIFTSDGSGTLSSVNAGLAAGLNFISSQTASGSASISFTSGLTSTYKEYMFVCTTIGPATDSTNFSFQTSTDGGSNYNVTVTTTYFSAENDEADTGNGIGYRTAEDQAQGTAFQILAGSVGNGADECCAGIVHLFSPASTTYVKQFYWTGNEYRNNDSTRNQFVAGYFNTTTAINAIQFKMSSGNLDGTIAMYGTG